MVVICVDGCLFFLNVDSCVAMSWDVVAGIFSDLDCCRSEGAPMM